MTIMIRLTLLFTLFYHPLFCQEIAITFDDAPLGNSQAMTGIQRTDKLLRELKSNDVKQVAFFVITGNIDSVGLERLQRYSNAGHLLANHTHSHRGIRDLGLAAYLNDIKKADSILRAMHGFVPWFRYPFLDEGRTIAHRDSIRMTVAKLGLFNGYVTVDNYDWYLNRLYNNALMAGKKPDMKKFKSLYIDHIWKSILYYDNIAKKILGRSPKHILLLHENDLSATFIGDLIKHLRAHNWKIITPLEAYTDPIANQIPNVLFNNQGRIGAIAYEKGMKPKDLVQESEDEEFLEKLVEELKVFREKM
jgi:peptidoglycan-N-acetylglucosamine deacetylase